jgi:hypothetical protein
MGYRCTFFDVIDLRNQRLVSSTWLSEPKALLDMNGADCSIGNGVQNKSGLI